MQCKVALSTHEIEFDGRSADLVSCLRPDRTHCDEHKLREEAVNLRKEAVSARTVVEAAPDGCWILDSNGRLLDVNAAYCRMSGYSREELLGMNASQIEDQSTGETTMRLQLGRVQGGGRYETKHRCRDGSLLDVEVSVGVMEAGAGDNMVLIRDVSERRRETVVAARRPTSARVPRRPVQAVRELR